MDSKKFLTVKDAASRLFDMDERKYYRMASKLPLEKVDEFDDIPKNIPQKFKVRIHGNAGLITYMKHQLRIAVNMKAHYERELRKLESW